MTNTTRNQVVGLMMTGLVGAGRPASAAGADHAAIPRVRSSNAAIAALIQQAGTIEPWFLCLAVASSIVGSSLGRLLLERLNDTQFRSWSNRLITAIGAYYVGHGLVMLIHFA